MSIIAADIWPMLGVLVAIAIGCLTALAGGLKWLADRARDDTTQREARFDEIGDSLTQHGERLSTIEGQLSIQPRRITTARGTGSRAARG